MKQYDYVIVGAGSAGCVLANRLSEDPALSVALIDRQGAVVARYAPTTEPKDLERAIEAAL